jgi:transposase
VLNVILYVAENGCKWRSLPKYFGPWHTVYTRMSRWAKKGVLVGVFAALQEEQTLRLKIEAVSLDSTFYVQPRPYRGRKRGLPLPRKRCPSAPFHW